MEDDGRVFIVNGVVVLAHTLEGAVSKWIESMYYDEYLWYEKKIGVEVREAGPAVAVEVTVDKLPRFNVRVLK